VGRQSHPIRRRPRGHLPDVQRGRLLREARNAEREERGRSAPAAPSCPTPRREFPLQSSAEVPISAVTACASRYRSHSSFVDGRDARLVMGRLPSVGDERSPRHPPLRARRLNLEGRGKGAWCAFSERRSGSPRGGLGLVQTELVPASPSQVFERGQDTDVWPVMHMEQEAITALNQP
jgi:hypothetical protein